MDISPDYNDIKTTREIESKRNGTFCELVNRYVNHKDFSTPCFK